MRPGAAEPRRAARQHGDFKDLLRSLAAEVEDVPFVHGAYDSVFVKDNALLWREGDVDQALLACPAHEERRMEQAARRRALESHGFRVQQVTRGVFEGGDFVRLPNDEGGLLGTGFRSTRLAAGEIERCLGAPVQVLELRDPSFYHLDTCLAALHDGTIAFCPDAFTRSSLRTLTSMFPGRLLKVPREAARTFALNIIEVGSHIIMGGPSAYLERCLKARGYTVHVPDLAQFRFAGGSAACLVARVHANQHIVATKSTAAIRSTAA